MARNFCVQIEQLAEDNYVASVVKLPTFHAQSHSMDELTSQLHAAIAECAGIAVDEVGISKQEIKLASGKMVSRSYDDAGQLTSEMYYHGMLAISLNRDRRSNGEIEEMYCVNKRLVSRARYEKERAKYPDMPTADGNLQDICGELVAGAALEQKRQRAAAKAHDPDAEQARQRDALCREVMEAGECQDATSWLESGRNNLGELTPAQSRKLVAKLLSLGSAKIHACRIDQEGELANTGHLVVELPDEVGARKSVLREVARIAAKMGFAGPADDGQRYAYLMLD